MNSLPRYSPPEQLDNLLQALADRSGRFGEASNFDFEKDWPLLVASGPVEVSFLEQELRRREYLEQTAESTLTMKGWERLAEIRKHGPSSTRAFVAMWFEPSLDGIYEQAIEPAIRQAGYEPLRIDRIQHVNRIDDEIIGQIRRSRFMVADFTGQRGGVYFEAGMMLGLGRTVIWMCKRLELQNVHFDARQYNFIDYETPGEAKKRLYDRILAVEGEGPNVSASLS